MTRWAVLIMVASTACLVGCGGAATRATRTTSLVITVWPKGNAGATGSRYELRCDPASGSLPDPESACAFLQKEGVDPFALSPANVPCTQLYGGPQKAHVRGRVKGESVNACLSRENGCEIARWDRLRVLLTNPA